MRSVPYSVPTILSTVFSVPKCVLRACWPVDLSWARGRACPDVIEVRRKTMAGQSLASPEAFLSKLQLASSPERLTF